MSSTLNRYPTATARASLAMRLSLPCHDSMQDWEWEIADVARFDEFLDVYRMGELDDDERFSLMEILVQCVEDSPPERMSTLWSKIEPILSANTALHASTIVYWAKIDETEPLALFDVSGGR